MIDENFHYSGLVRRAITGVILGAIAGVLDVWVFKQDITHLWAAVVAGPTYMITLAVLTDRLQLAGAKRFSALSRVFSLPWCGGPLPCIPRMHSCLRQLLVPVLGRPMFGLKRGKVPEYMQPGMQRGFTLTEILPQRIT